MITCIALRVAFLTSNLMLQDFYEVAKFDKRTKLEELMQDPERDPKERTLIFVQTKKNADFLATYLSGEGLPTTSIHGDRCLLHVSSMFLLIKTWVRLSHLTKTSS